MRKKITVPAFKELGDLSKYRTILSYGIVNPFGPTLNFLITYGDLQNLNSLPVYLLQLHPFSPEIVKKWTLSKESNAKQIPIDDISDDLCNMGGSCPTLFIPGTILSAGDEGIVLARIVASKEGGVKTFENCKRFPAKAFDRVTYEIEHSGHQLLERQVGMPSSFNSDKLSKEEAREFVLFQSRPEYVKSEFDAFLLAYKGAIEHVPTLSVKLPYKDFLAMFKTLVFGQE